MRGVTGGATDSQKCQGGEKIDGRSRTDEWTILYPDGRVGRVNKESKIMNKYRYSPLDISHYRLVGVPQDEISVILEVGNDEAIWNLFWLSVPELDAIPGSGTRWDHVYRPVEEALAAVIRDVLDDEVMLRKVVMHPDQFAEWFEREDQSIYDAYDVLGGKMWVKTVLERARKATDRLILEAPPMVVHNNVISILSRRAA